MILSRCGKHMIQSLKELFAFLCLERHPPMIKHKQDWGRGFILLQPQNAALSASDAGSDGVKPALGFAIQQSQTLCSV